MKLTWEPFLSVNKALTKNFLLNFHPDLIFCGLFFFVPGPLGGLKNVSGDVFRHTDSIGSS